MCGGQSQRGKIGLLPCILDQPTVGFDRFGQVQLAEFIQHCPALVRQRGNEAEQLHEAFEMFLNFTSAPGAVAVLGIPRAVHRAAIHCRLLQNMNVPAGHMPVTDQKSSRRQRADASSDQIGFFRSDAFLYERVDSLIGSHLSSSFHRTAG
ncbi:hypothetical protein D3C75_917390 [compost metagenome]